MKRKILHWYDKILSLLLSILGFGASTGFTACLYGAEYEPDPDFDKHIRVDPQTLEFGDTAGETKEVKIYGSNNVKWNVSYSKLKRSSCGLMAI